MGRGSNLGGTERDLIAVAVNAGKGSQEALKWALEKLIPKGQVVILLHVRKKITTIPTPNGQKLPLSEVPADVAAIFLHQRDTHTKEIFVPLRCICNRRRVQLKEVVLDDVDISKAIVNFAKHQTVDRLVLGASSKNALVRTFRMDLPAYVAKHAPDFCSVYVISKGRILSLRAAPQQYLYPAGRPDSIFETHVTAASYARSEPDAFIYNESTGSSPLVDYARKDKFSRAGAQMDHRYHSTASCPAPSVASIEPRSDYSSRGSFIMGKRPNYSSPNMPQKFTSSDESMASCESKASGYSYSSTGSSGGRCPSLPSRSQQRGRSVSKDQSDVDMEISRLRLQLKQSTILHEDTQIQMLGAAQSNWRKQENGTVDKSEIDMRRGEALLDRQVTHDFRKYSIDEIETITNNFCDTLKNTEGAPAIVFRSVYHNVIVIKLLQYGLDQSTEQFELEVARLSRLNHPNVISFIGICLEVRCLVCKHTFNGFLEDHLSTQSTTSPIPWQNRLKIAADIASGLHFLQEFTAKPLGLEPGSILLTHNFTAKLLPVSSAHADPECQRGGLESMESDVYALGIIFLQLITAAPLTGLVMKVREAMEVGRIREVVDHNVSEWPLESIKDLARLALRCTEFVGKNRLDLGSEVLSELNWLLDFYV